MLAEDNVPGVRSDGHPASSCNRTDFERRDLSEMQSVLRFSQPRFDLHTLMCFFLRIAIFFSFAGISSFTCTLRLS